MRVNIPNQIVKRKRFVTVKTIAVVIVIAGVFFVLGGMLGGLAGAGAYKDGVTSSSGAVTWVQSKLRQWGLEQIISVRSTISAPELVKLQLDIAFEDFEKIRAKRDEAVAATILFSSDDDLVPATITVDGKVLDAKVRLKGDFADHLKTNKWSYRIELAGDDRAFGMRRFSVQNPSTRYFHFEQAYLENLRAEGILAPRYEFVELAVNGEDLGIYALEEFMGKELIESQGRRSGVLLAFSEQYFWDHIVQQPQCCTSFELVDHSYTSLQAYMNVFDQGRVSKNPGLQSQADFAVMQLRKLQEGTAKPSDVFDVEKMATFLALSELWRAHHTLVENNLRFYYNPISGLLEPVGFDGNPSPRLVSVSDLFFSDDRPSFIKSVLDDPEIATQYIRELGRVSDPKYLDEIRAQLGAKSANSLRSLQAEFPGLKSVWSEVSTRQALLRKIINPPLAGVAYGQLDTGDPESPAVILDVGNPLAVPVEVVGIRATPRADNSGDIGVMIDADRPVNDGESWIVPARHTFSDPLVFQRMSLSIPDSVAEIIENGGEINLKVRVLGQEIVRISPVVFIPEIAATSNWRPRGYTVDDAFEAHSFLQIESPGVLSIGPGEWIVSSDLVIPAGHVLSVKAGATLRFGQGVKLVSTSPVHLMGSESSPVVLEPLNASWAGVFVQRAGDVSVWRNAIIRNTEGIYEPGRLITGGVTFNESPLTLRNVFFDGSQAEDALNVVLAGIDFEDVLIAHTVSDGFDGDAVIGRIDRTEFLNIGGDGLDVSASEITGSHLNFAQIGDKAISIGEVSKAQFSDISVVGAGIGIASKDMSYVEIKGADFEDIAHFALASYQKKPEYGPAILRADDIRHEGLSGRYAAEEASEIRVDGRVITTSELDVDQLYAAGILGN